MLQTLSLVENVRAVDCHMNQPDTWLILAIDLICGGYLFLVESTAMLIVKIQTLSCTTASHIIV